MLAITLAAALAAAQPADLQFSHRETTCAYTPGTNVLTSTRTAYSPSTGDHYFVVDEMPTSVADSGFVDGRSTDWFRNYEDITLNGATYSRYGLPRVVGANELVFFAEYQGAPLLAEPGAGDRPDILYALIDAIGCEVQPFQRNP